MCARFRSRFQGSLICICPAAVDDDPGHADEAHQANREEDHDLSGLFLESHSTTTTVLPVKLIGPNPLSSGVTVRY